VLGLDVARGDRGPVRDRASGPNVRVTRARKATRRISRPCEMTLPRARKLIGSSSHGHPRPQPTASQPVRLRQANALTAPRPRPPLRANHDDPICTATRPRPETSSRSNSDRITLYAQKVLKTSRRSLAPGAASGQKMDHRQGTACKTRGFKVAEETDVLGRLRTSCGFLALKPSKRCLGAHESTATSSSATARAANASATSRASSARGA
jgi:hypothetical protein